MSWTEALNLKPLLKTISRGRFKLCSYLQTHCWGPFTICMSWEHPRCKEIPPPRVFISVFTTEPLLREGVRCHPLSPSSSGALQGEKHLLPASPAPQPAPALLPRVNADGAPTPARTFAVSSYAPKAQPWATQATFAIFPQPAGQKQWKMYYILHICPTQLATGSQSRGCIVTLSWSQLSWFVQACKTPLSQASDYGQRTNRQGPILAPAAKKSTPSTWPYREVGSLEGCGVSSSLGLPVGQLGLCWRSFQAPSFSCPGLEVSHPTLACQVAKTSMPALQASICKLHDIQTQV